MSTQGHPAAPLLQELADEAKVNAEPWRAFEWKDSNFFSETHNQPPSLSALLMAVEVGGVVRRRPKTVRVCGEVPEDAIRNAEIWRLYGQGADVRHDLICDALLSLVEESK